MKTGLALLAVLSFAGTDRGLAAQSVLFDSNRWPPTNGMFIGLQTVPFANGVVLSNVTWRAFSDSIVLPPLGGSAIVTFSSTANIQLSVDGGATFTPAQATADAVVKINHSSDSRGTFTFDAEMLQLNLSGGTLPGGAMIRESPTQASTGQTETRLTSNGYLISSFFDVFLEVSFDGGQNWKPSVNSAQIELRADPMSMPPGSVPTTLLPPPCCAYTNAGSFFASFPNGMILRNAKMHFFNFAEPAPGTGGTRVYTSTPQLDFQFSSDGLTFFQGRAPASLAMVVRYRMNVDATQFLDTEMLSLSLQGGDLPPGLMIRESPTIASAGGLTLTPTGGVYRVQSFFDLWMELSVDGGQSWAPTTAPSRVVLDCPADENPFPSPNTPPSTGRYLSLGNSWASYPQGIVIRNMVVRSPSQSLPPPAPGGSQVQTFNAQTDFQLSTDGGQTFSAGSAPALASARLQSSADSGNTRYFDTEMLQLNISGGSLPGGLMIRESPSRASLGSLSERTTATDYRISSFFDVFTEISLDGGQTWSPSIGPPGEIILVPSSSADLRLTMTASVETALVGQMISYKIIVTNPGPDAASGVVMRDLLPENFTFNSLVALQGSFSLAGNAVIWTLSNLAAGVDAMIVINATPDGPGLRTNSASVAANEPDPNLSDNSATVVTPVQLPLLSVSLAQGSVLVSWPAAADGFRLLQRTNFSPGTLWGAVTIRPSANGDRSVVELTPPLGTSFFELTRP